MPTQSEQLASAISAITQLNQTFTAEVANWQLQRTNMQNLLNQAVAAVPNLVKRLYVNALTGANSNTGSSNSPFQTLDKALEIAATMSAGSCFIAVAPGVYEWGINRDFQKIHLEIISNSSNETILNFPESGVNTLRGTSVRLDKVTIRRFGEGGSPHLPMFRLYNGAILSLGSWESGVTTSVLNRFKYVATNSPLFRTENGWAMVWLEKSFFECLAATPMPLYESRNQTLVEMMASASQNFTLPKTTLTYVQLGAN